jgi:hypothetical protein
VLRCFANLGLFMYICCMARIAGITYKKDDSGKKRFVTIDLDKWGEQVQDLLDLIEAEKRRGEPRITWDKVKTEMHKQHGL